MNFFQFEVVVGCPVCAGEYPMREISKHIQSCFVRSERQTTYGTDYMVARKMVEKNTIFTDTEQSIQPVLRPVQQNQQILLQATALCLC